MAHDNTRRFKPGPGGAPAMQGHRTMAGLATADQGKARLTMCGMAAQPDRITLEEPVLS